MPFDTRILANAPGARRRVLAILDAALAAVDPYRAVLNHLHLQGETLTVSGVTYDLPRYRRIRVLGAGKAGAPMARAVEAALGDRIQDGLVVVKYGHGGATQRVEIGEAGHPVPDDAGVAAGRRVLAMAADAAADDLVIVLLSGGGSALLEAPAGITLPELQVLTGALLACGATINEINCLRKHMSLLKGGQLARAVYPAALVTLVLSDVVGSPLDVIASGPTVPDRTTWADAWQIVVKYDLGRRLPKAVIRRLEQGRTGQLADTPKPGEPVFDQAQCVIVGDNRSAAQAAWAEAEAYGYRSLLLSTYCEGEARELAKTAVALAKEVKASGHPLDVPACMILGGETTVTLGAASGKGGRNQELALAAALGIAGLADVTIAALATDGSDGPTDSAGAIVDGATVARGAALGLAAADYLRRHDAYPYLAATGDLLRSGPTQTNVNDLVFVFVE